MQINKEIMVRGVLITLNRSQIAKIKKELAERKECRGSVEKILLHFGFKKLDTIGWVNPKQNCYQHLYYNWFAEILDHGGWQEVWLVGQRLRDGGFPGGWCYSGVEELQEAIEVGLDKLSNDNE